VQAGARERGERGAVLLFLVIAFAAVGSIVALAVNVGRVYSVRAALQNGADGAAIAAAAELDGTVDGLEEGDQAASAVAALHGTDSGLSIVVEPGEDVTFGIWHREAVTPWFEPVQAPGDGDLRRMNAVQVRAGREASRGNAVPVVLASGLLGREELDVAADAIAVGGGPCELDVERAPPGTAFAAAVAECSLVDPDTEALLCDAGRHFVLNDVWDDSMGFSSVEPGSPATAGTIAHALDMNHRTAVDDEIAVTNAIMTSNVLSHAYFSALPRDVTVPVVAAAACARGPRAARAATFSGDMTIVGYATFTLCYRTGATASPSFPGWPSTCGAPPTAADFPGVDPATWTSSFLPNSLFLRARCGVEQPAQEAGVAGCEYFGTSSPRSRLVR
jgi:Flp pilus assembly protein TadG